MISIFSSTKLLQPLVGVVFFYNSTKKSERHFKPLETSSEQNDKFKTTSNRLLSHHPLLLLLHRIYLLLRNSLPTTRHLKRNKNLNIPTKDSIVKMLKEFRSAKYKKKKKEKTNKQGKEFSKGQQSCFSKGQTTYYFASHFETGSKKMWHFLQITEYFLAFFITPSSFQAFNYLLNPCTLRSVVLDILKHSR